MSITQLKTRRKARHIGILTTKKENIWGKIAFLSSSDYKLASMSRWIASLKKSVTFCTYLGKENFILEHCLIILWSVLIWWTAVNALLYSHKCAATRQRFSPSNETMAPTSGWLSDRFPVKNHNKNHNISTQILVDKRPSQSRAVHYQCYHRHDTIQPPVKRSHIKFFAFAAVTKGDSTQGV